MSQQAPLITDKRYVSKIKRDEKDALNQPAVLNRVDASKNLRNFEYLLCPAVLLQGVNVG